METADYHCGYREEGGCREVNLQNLDSTESALERCPELHGEEGEDSFVLAAFLEKK